MIPDARPLLEAALDALRGAEPFEAAEIESALRDVVERGGVKPRQVFQPLRVAITGTTVSPGIFESLTALGREAAMERVERALERL
jgi:glutamyl-tRNA synthetase